MDEELLLTLRQFRVYAAETVIGDLRARMPFVTANVVTVGEGCCGPLFPLVAVEARIDDMLYEDPIMGALPEPCGRNLFIPLLFDGGATRLPVEFFEALPAIPADTLHLAFVGLGGSVNYVEVVM